MGVVGKVVKRAYTYRFYPTPEQADVLNRTFGCVRLVYNRALAQRSRIYASEHRNPSYVESSAWLTGWKASDELGFLNEVSSVPLQQALRHLQAGFVAFFANRARYPRCSGCGVVKNSMPLHIRVWACACGAVHGRDVNAARSILAAGLVER